MVRVEAVHHVRRQVERLGAAQGSAGRQRLALQVFHNINVS